MSYFRKIIKCDLLLCIYFVFSANFTGMNSQRDYCKSNICGDSKTHTLCKFQMPGPSPHCLSYEKTLIKEMDKEDILDKINSRRNKVASGDIRSLPSAQNMLKLEWHDELQHAAQRWADQCVPQGSPDETDSCRDLENISVGQNVASIYGESPGLTPSVLVDLWYMELLNLNISIISSYQPSDIMQMQHYDYFTQMVWADTRFVGCGAVKFKEIIKEFDFIRNRTVYRLVCNFAVSGNRRDEPVYADGISCSRCPKDYSCDIEYKALCSISSNVSQESDLVRKFKHDNDYLASDITMENATENLFRVTKTEHNYNDQNVSQIKSESDNNFDLFSYLFEISTSSSTPTTSRPVKCNDVIAVDEFIEILRSKLNNEQMLRDLLFSSKSINGEDSSDATVAAIVRKLYSKNIPSTTIASTKTEDLNSTILADLVEAVIFRHSDKISSTEKINFNTNSIPEVSAVKILAELGEVKLNREFTGHYFIPEEVGTDEDQSDSEPTESYYDTSNFPLSEIVFEIEDLKRKQATKDFLEDILESDSITENPKPDVDFSTSVTTSNNDGDKINGLPENSNHEEIKRLVRACKYDENNIHKDTKYKFMSYKKILKKLANDFRELKLNERFHCASNRSSNVISNILSLFLSLLAKYIY